MYWMKSVLQAFNKRKVFLYRMLHWNFSGYFACRKILWVQEAVEPVYRNICPGLLVQNRYVWLVKHLSSKSLEILCRVCWKSITWCLSCVYSLPLAFAFVNYWRQDAGIAIPLVAVGVIFLWERKRTTFLNFWRQCLPPIPTHGHALPQGSGRQLEFPLLSALHTREPPAGKHRNMETLSTMWLFQK